MRDIIFARGEKYMFYGMCYARHIVFVAKASDIDVEGGASLICL